MADYDVANFWIKFLSLLGAFLNDHGLFDISFASLFAVSSVFSTIVGTILTFSMNPTKFHRDKQAYLNSKKEKVQL